MRRYFSAIVILVLLALDWAALHDILKGNEPDLYLEYGMVTFIIIVFGLMTFFYLKKRRRQKSIT